MNIQELSTCKQYHLTPKVLCLNNRYLGMVRQWQQIEYGSRYSESYVDARQLRASCTTELDDLHAFFRPSFRILQISAVFSILNATLPWGRQDILAVTSSSIHSQIPSPPSQGEEPETVVGQR